MSLLARKDIQPAAKAALEAHPLFAGGRVPVITNYIAPGERNHEREQNIREKGAVLEISPVLRERVAAFRRPSVLAKDCTFSVAIRMSPTLVPGNSPLLPLTPDTAVDAVEAALLGLGFALAVPFASLEPEPELAQLVEDADGLLSTAIFFTVRCHIAATP